MDMECSSEFRIGICKIKHMIKWLKKKRRARSRGQHAAEARRAETETLKNKPPWLLSVSVSGLVLVAAIRSRLVGLFVVPP